MTSTVNDTTGRIDYLSGYPLVLVMCDNCGYILPFSAKKLGIVK